MPIEALSATLMGFAAGALAEPLSAACSVHVSMCAQCRSELRDMELLGATLVGSTPTGGGRVGPPIKPHEAQLDAHRGAGEVNADDLPAPLARRYDLALDQIPWKRLAPCRLPLHGHTGVELTVVLTGAFADAFGEYRRGDMQDIDNSIEHQPLGDRDEGCICLVAAEGPYLLRG